MDAFEIARLMANRDPTDPVRLRFGTVKSVDESGTLLVVPDGHVAAVPTVRCCRPDAGDRVVVLASATEWLAVAVVRGELIADKVVERGESGVWTWRKWASGDAECHTKFEIDRLSPYSTWNGMSAFNVGNISFPEGLFASEPSTTAGGIVGSGHAIISRCSGSKDFVQVIFLSSEAGEVRITVSVQAKGRWRL